MKNYTPLRFLAGLLLFRMRIYRCLARCGLLSVAALLVIVGNERSYAQEFDTPSLVWEQCAACHALGRSDNSPHPAAPPLKQMASRYDLDRLYETFVTGTLIPGHQDMPLFKLDRATARAVINYLRAIEE